MRDYLTLGKLTSLAISQDKSPIKTNTVLCIREDSYPPRFKLHLVSSDNPEYLSDGVFIFHNPHAINKISTDLFSQTNAVNINFDIASEVLMFEGNNLPIFSRLNLAYGKDYITSSLKRIFYSFNPDIILFTGKVFSILDEGDQYEVTFVDMSDNEIELPLIFSKEKFDQEKCQEGDIYKITFKILDEYKKTFQANSNFTSIDSNKLQKFYLLHCASNLRIVGLDKLHNRSG